MYMYMTYIYTYISHIYIYIYTHICIHNYVGRRGPKSSKVSAILFPSFV